MLHHQTLFNAYHNPGKRVYSSYWLACIDKLKQINDLRVDGYEIGYYRAIRDRVMPSGFYPSDYSHMFTDIQKQDIRPAIAMYEKLSADLTLEDDELELPVQSIDDPKYRYINADRQISHTFKYALVKSETVLDQIQKRVNHQEFKNLIAETYEEFREYPL